MGIRNSKRSMDVSTTPKKEGVPSEAGDVPAVGDGKLERIEESDGKPTTNGVTPHTDSSEDKDKDKDKDSTTEKEKKDEEETKVTEETKDTKAETPVESPEEGSADVTTPTEGTTPASPTAVSPDSKDAKKKKEKSKNKWSFRSISFGKKDKNKPVREDTPKNGDISTDTLAEGGEEAETATSPAEDKSVVSTTESGGDGETKGNDDNGVTSAAPTATTTTTTGGDEKSPVEENKEGSLPPSAPTPVPVEAKKEELEKEVEKIVEVSRVQMIGVAPVEVTSQTKPIVTPSIIERKTSEDFPTPLPSSPPPTPIDPSPLQQAQQAAANPSALAEALKLPQCISVSSFNNQQTISCNVNQIKDTESIDNLQVNQVDNNHIHQSDAKVDDGKIDDSVDLVVESEEGPVPVDIKETVSTNQSHDEALKECVDDNQTNTLNEVAEPQVDENETKIVEVEEEIVVQEVTDEVTSEIEEITEDLVEVVETSDDNQEIVEEIQSLNLNEQLKKWQDEEGGDETILAIIKEKESTLECEQSNERLLTEYKKLLKSGCKPSKPFKLKILGDLSDVNDSNVGILHGDVKKSIENFKIKRSELKGDDLVRVVYTYNDSASKIQYEIVVEEIPVDVKDDEEEEAPPPLPESSIPIAKASVDLMNFMATQIDEIPFISGRIMPVNKPNDDELENDKLTEEFDLSKGLPSDLEEDAALKQVPLSPSPKNLIDQLLTPPRSPSPFNNHDIIHINNKQHEDDNNVDDRELTNEDIACHILKNDYQSIPEPEVKATTEIIAEPPKSPAIDVPVSAPAPPAITEDVASVTKAIEEIDINEKAVAAAVNENIESNNDIIADMNHQNKLNE